MKSSRVLLVFTLLVAVSAIYFHKRLIRLYNVATLFDEKYIEENFRSAFHRGFPSRVALPGNRVAEFKSDTRELPREFEHDGKSYNTQEFLHQKWATGMVVLKVDGVTDARLLHEQYWRGNARESLAISWSMGKSVVSALFGIAVGEGLIRSIEDKVTDYAPELVVGGYNGVRIKDVLQMASGIRFSEDYFDSFSDINLMGKTLALGFSINDFVANLVNERVPGTYNHYVSMDTQVLGIVLSKVIAPDTLTSYLEKKIWQAAGMEDRVHWMLDNEHDAMELAFGTLNARTRDFARFGWLYLNGGKSPLDGQQLVPEKWVRDSLTPDAPYLMPGDQPGHDYPWGYGYQWWLPGSEADHNVIEGDFVALGIYNQFIYVNPKHRIVIARNSAYPRYKEDTRESEQLAIACFRKIAQAFADV